MGGNRSPNSGVTASESPFHDGGATLDPVVVGSDELESFWRREVRPAARALVLGGVGLVWVGYWGIALPTYTYSASAGNVTGTGASASYSSTGAPTGPVSVTCNVADDKGHNASSNTNLTILAPPLPP